MEKLPTLAPPCTGGVGYQVASSLFDFAKFQPAHFLFVQ